MPRKGHKKSRLGCAECKKRHVKCDESRVEPGPRCVNCKTANIKCSFIDEPAPRTLSVTSSDAAPQSQTVSSANSPNIFDFNNYTFVGVHTPPAHPLSSSSVNINHLELFHQFVAVTFKSFNISDAIANRYCNTIVRTGFQYPFLMHEILAIAALHFSVSRPDRCAFYREQAAELQSLAVQGFNQVLPNINDENCVAMFLFSSLVGIHAFCDNFTRRNDDFNIFLDKLTDSINLLRGVRTVTGQCWEALKRSELREHLDLGQLLHSCPVTEQQECSILRKLIDEADLSTTSQKAYDTAITELQRIYNVEETLHHAEGTIGMLFAWLVTSDAVYAKLLSQRRPEALIILAYYAVILHRRRSSWAIQDAGQYLVRSITSYLGSHWARWLDWPNAMVDASSSMETTT